MEKNILTTGGNFTILNFKLVEKVSLRTALFIGYVYSLQKHYEESNQLTIIDGKGYVYCTKEYIAKNLDIKRESLRIIVNKLVEMGILANVVRGNLHFYSINEDILNKFLDDSSKENCCHKLIDAEIVKKERKHNEMSAMFARINVFTDDPNLRDLLGKYLRIRKTRGLQILQWNQIMDSFERYIPPALMVQRLQRAIEGGWLTLTFDSDIEKYNRECNKVIYNAPSDEAKDRELQEYLNSLKGTGKQNDNDEREYY